jgi:hypothetical protein
MALVYDSRRTTEDADVIINPTDVAVEVLAAAEKIAPDFGLPSGWMNENARSFIIEPPAHERGREVLATDSVVFEVPSTERLLGMKLARWAGSTDVEDGQVLLRKLKERCADEEEVWSLVGGLIPVAKRDNGRHYLATLWEMLDESA